jgi:hypothetical protein
MPYAERRVRPVGRLGTRPYRIPTICLTMPSLFVSR